MQRGSCAKCGSTRVMRDARVIDRNGEYQDMNLSVRVETKPEALLFKGAKDFELKAHVCGECGYAELYAAEPDKLWQTYVGSRGSEIVSGG